MVVAVEEEEELVVETATFAPVYGGCYDFWPEMKPKLALCQLPAATWP